MLPILRGSVNPEARAQRPSLRTHTWETTHFPPRGGDPARTKTSRTQPLTPVSARDLRGPGGVRGREAPLPSGEVGKGKLGLYTGRLLTRMARSPSSARTPHGEASKAAAA